MSAATRLFAPSPAAILSRPAMTTSTKDSRSEIFAVAFRALRPRTPVPQFEIRFRPYADVNNVIRIRDAKVVVGLSDLLEGAPRTVLEAIAFILLAKLYRKPVPKRHQNRYRQFLNRRSVRKQAQALRQTRGRKWIGSPQGAHFHLEEIFDDLNGRYFSGLLGRPLLSWSRTASRTALGHFDSAHNAIIISKIFDRPDLPRLLVEYLLYHEMLHLKYPVVHRAARRCFHSPLFRAEERRFPHFAEAKKLLDTL
jgi:hypothetical protein